MNAKTSNLKSDKSTNAIRLILLKISWHCDIFYSIDTRQNGAFEKNHFISQAYIRYVCAFVEMLKSVIYMTFRYVHLSK